jgi:ATP-binding protein involved in chromosome partitioning
VLGIIENMAWFTPAELPDNKYYIFGEGGGKRLAVKHEVPLIGQLPLIQAVREAGDAGRPAVLADVTSPEAATFRELAESLARQVSIRNNVAPKTTVVTMNP